MRNPIRAFVFIDLDSARRIKRAPWKSGANVPWQARRSHATDVFSELQVRVSALLCQLRPSLYSTVVKSRIYHGWHRGRTPTDDRRIWEDARASFRPYKVARASYLPDIEFGDRLLCGGNRMPLLDTVRNTDGEDRQKMIDTAIVSDLLYTARSESAAFGRGIEPSVMALLIADDDDILPGAIMSEAWGLPTYLVRVTRKGENAFLQTKGMVMAL